MQINIECENCHRPLRVAAEQAGQEIACPACGATVAVPQLPSTDPEPPIEFEKGPADEEEDMDLTPMVDVTFLLLIFFMFTAAFSMQKSLEIPNPDQDETAEARTLEDLERDTVIVRVDGDNIFWIASPDWAQEREAASEFDLLRALREAREPGSGRRGPTKMLVMANGEVRHEFVVKALDAGTDVGMEDVRLTTVEDDS